MEGSKLVPICSVHSILSTTNIPIEVFLRIDEQAFRRIVIAFYQSDQEVREYFNKYHCGTEVDFTSCEATKSPIRSVFRLASAIRQKHPAIVHVHHATSAAVAAFLSRLLSKAKVVTTVHNNFQWYRKSQKLALGWSILWSHMVVCNSENTLKSITGPIAWLLRRKLVRVVYNGVNSSMITDALMADQGNRFRKSDDEVIVAFIARLVHAKDAGTTIKAFAELMKRHERVKLYVAGDGPLRGQLEQQAKELGCGDRVQFLGMIPRADVYSLLREADIFTVSSLFEGFCNAMVEAMFAGKAIVSSDIDVLQEVLGVDCGRFFPVGDSSMMCEHLSELSNDSQLRASLGARAQERANARYRMEICEMAYTHCYRELLPN